MSVVGAGATALSVWKRQSGELNLPSERPAALPRVSAQGRPLQRWQSGRVSVCTVRGAGSVQCTRHCVCVCVRTCVLPSDQVLEVTPLAQSRLVRFGPTEPGMGLGALQCASQDWRGEGRERDNHIAVDRTSLGPT